MESLDAFGERARAWIGQNLPEEGDTTLTDPELQAVVFDAGFAGIAFPKEYGGAGLTLQHQKVFFDTAAEMGRRVPAGYMVSIGMMAATLLDHGVRGAEAAPSPANPARRRRVDAAAVGAERRVRHGRRAHAAHA